VREKRQYSDTDRGAALAALDANGGNVNKTARETGVPRVTLIEWRDGRVSADVSNIRQEKRGSLADALEGIIGKALDIRPEKLADASVRDLNGTVKITAETMQLLRGQPTSIQETRQDLTEDERADHAAALLQCARDRRAAAVADPGGAGGTRQPPAVN